MSDDEIRQFIGDHEWTFAKTMPTIPHWYTLRNDLPSAVRSMTKSYVQT